MDANEKEKARRKEVFRRAEEIFKDPHKASTWLNSPNYALDGQVPLHLIGTDEGTALVLDELGRIEHGVFL